jgi:hypothetical protein
VDLIVATVLGNAVGVGAVGFLLKLWVDKRLSHSLDLELEKFKSEMAKEVARHSFQQKWVNDKRMELLSQLNELVVDMAFELKALFINIKVQSQEFTEVRASKFCEKYVELNAVLHKNELFLSSGFLEEVRAVYKPYFDLGVECMRGDGSMAEKLRHELPETLEEIAVMADKPRICTVQAFRKAAGVDASQATPSK